MIHTFIGNWDKVASLVLSVVAICIALFSSRQTSKQAKEQIEELRKLAESNAADADRQVENIKQMTTEALDGMKKQMIGVRELSCKILEYSVFNLDESVNKSLEERQELSEKQEKLLKTIEKEKEQISLNEQGGIHFFDGKGMSVYDKRLYYLNRKITYLTNLREDLCSLKNELERESRDAMDEAIKHGTFDKIYPEERFYRN